MKRGKKTPDKMPTADPSMETPDPRPDVLKAPPLPGEGPLVICDANDRPIMRVPETPQFRITYAGRSYERFATDAAEGRWLYRPM